MNKTIYIFTLNGCPRCKELTERLLKEKIDFKEVDIDEYEELWETVVNESGQDYVPTLFIQDDEENNGNIYTPMNDYQDINELMLIIYENLKGK